MHLLHQEGDPAHSQALPAAQHTRSGNPPHGGGTHVARAESEPVPRADLPGTATCCYGSGPFRTQLERWRHVVRFVHVWSSRAFSWEPLAYVWSRGLPSICLSMYPLFGSPLVPFFAAYTQLRETGGRISLGLCGQSRYRSLLALSDTDHFQPAFCGYRLPTMLLFAVAA